MDISGQWGGEAYGYDANGNLTSFTNTGGDEITYAYDDADRLTSLTWDQGGPDTVFEYSYNAANQLTGVVRKFGTTTESTYSYSYDSAARLSAVTMDGRTLAFSYDAAQNVSQLEYPSSLEVNFEYTELNRLETIRDDLNNVISGYVYDADGRLTKRMLENGLETVYEYNDAGWVTKIELRESAAPANVLQHFEYGYDKVGNRLWSKYLNGRGDVYNYDANYQVIGVKYDVDDPTDGYALATGAARAVTYAYDAVGNRTSMVDGANTTTYAVNDLNQYTSVGAVNPGYSAEGYLTEYGDWTYVYDHAGYLVEASRTGLTISYEYDARGRRVSRSDGTNTVFYIYSGLNLIEERDGSGTVLAEYVYDGTLIPRKAIIDGDEYYFQQDVLGNVTALMDDQGDVVESYTYDVYGMPEVWDGSGNPLAAPMTPFLFTGHYWDEGAELYHARYRSYSPELGGWLTRDPIGFVAGVNLYSYVFNNPLAYVDYFGLMETTPFSGLYQVSPVRQEQMRNPAGTPSEISNPSGGGAIGEWRADMAWLDAWSDEENLIRICRTKLSDLDVPLGPLSENIKAVLDAPLAVADAIFTPMATAPGYVIAAGKFVGNLFK